MAKISKGILGGFSGKVGSVVGAKWRDKDVIRSLPRPSGKLPTEAQRLQRLKFGTVAQFLYPIRPIQDRYFGAEVRHRTRVNQATSYILKNALELVDEIPEIIHERVLITKGDLAGFQGLKTIAVPGGLKVDWQDNSRVGNAAPTDKVNVVCHCPELVSFLLFEEETTRDALSATVDIPEMFLEKELHAWVYLNNEIQTKASTSLYQGVFSVE